jgi:hypothetical protein
LPKGKENLAMKERGLTIVEYGCIAAFKANPTYMTYNIYKAKATNAKG